LTAPHDRVLLELAARGSLEYAFGPVTDELETLPPAAKQRRQELLERATALYGRALVYSSRALATLDKSFPQALAGDAETTRRAAAHLGKRAARALLFAGMALAASADLNRGDLSHLVDLPKAIVLLERAHALDPDDAHSAAAMMLGMIYASPAFAGEEATSKRWFDEAARRTHGKFLPIPGFMARTYAVAVGDRALFQKTLKQVRDTPGDVEPNARLPNLLARRRAARDLAHEDEFFSRTKKLSRRPVHRAGS
jgi:hypothetical protein